MSLEVRERIHFVRLMDKLRGNPAMAEKLGIVIMNGPGDIGNAGSESSKG